MSDLILGDALEAIIDHRGKTPAKLGGDFSDSGIPVISAALVRDGRLTLGDARYISREMYSSWMRVPTQRHDVILTSEAPLGRVALVADNSPLVLGQRVFGLRGKSGILDSRFLYYVLQTSAVQTQLQGRSSGTTVSGIRQSELVQVVISAPSFTDQQAIASVLGALDDKIASDVQRSFSCHDLALAHATLAFSGAESQPLGAVADIVMGSSPPGSTYNSDGVGIPFYQGSRDFGFRFPLARTWCSQPIRMAREDEILVSVRAPVGRLNMAFEECCIGRGLARISSRSGRPSTLFYALNLISDQWQMYESHGTVFSSIDKTRLANIIIPVPGRAIADSLEVKLALLDAQVRNASRESSTLVELRAALLPKLMSGEIRVRDAEKIVEDVT